MIIDQSVGRWVCEKIGSEFREDKFCIGEGSPLESGAIFEKYNGSSVLVTLATDKSFSKEFINKIHEIAFKILKVNHVIVQVSSSNAKSLNLVRKLKFKQRGLIPKGMPDGDMLIFSLSRDDRKFGVDHG